MKKKYFILFFFFLLTNYSFAQSVGHTAISKSKTENAPEIDSKKPENTVSEKVTVFEKKPLPSNTKNSPAIFYVENDKPVDLKRYQEVVKQQYGKN